MERLPQSVALRVPLKAYLASDHVSVATGKTLAVVISKNGAAFGNPSAGATNATEIGNGWYYVDLSTADTGTLGPLVVRATAATVDDVEIAYGVVDANSLGAANLDAAISTRSTYAGGPVASVTAPVTAGTVSDKTGYSLATAPPTAAEVTTAVWAAGTRTLSSFGSLVADVATAVWGAASRTLSAFGFTVAATVADKTGYALTSAYDPAKTAAQASDVPLATIAAISAKVDNLPVDPAATSDIPTAAAVADKVLGRNLAGASDGGRTVTSALRALRNKVTISGSTLTVYAEDDSTVAYTATITTDAAADPITGVDPA
jgi:hypothetical protein